MLFSVIYNVTVHGDEKLNEYLPRKSLRKYIQGGVTDNEFEYLGEGWEKGKCWQGSGILTRTQFEAFIDDCDLMSEDVETMGSLGGPLGGLVADINFRADHYAAIVTCRVTPILDRTPKLMEKEDEGVWQRVRNAVIRQYSRGRGSHFTKVPYEARRKWQERYPNWGQEYASQCKRELAKATQFWSTVNA